MESTIVMRQRRIGDSNQMKRKNKKLSRQREANQMIFVFLHPK